MTRPLAVSALLAAALGLGACEKQVEAPMQAGTCWQMVTRNAKVAFNPVSQNEPRIETCAASLEAMRLRFLSLGGSAEDIDGAYQGQFLFLRKEGVFTSQTLKGERFILLVRTDDGQLEKLGAQPTPP